MTGRWLHPEWWPALAAIALAGFAALGWSRARAGRRMRELLGARGPALLAPTFWSDAALAAAGVAVMLALLGPRLGELRVSEIHRGVDVVFLLDVSRSMDARDTPPSRLHRARRAAAEILAQLAPGDRAGLVVFAARGAVLSPLTPDREALLQLLRGVDSGWMRPASSQLSAGVESALEVLSGSLRPRRLVLLSDGEAAAGDAAARARRAGVRILTAGFGEAGGATIPTPSGPLRDASGREVRSRLRPKTLDGLAAATGGERLAVDAWGRIDVSQAREALHRDAGSRPGERVTRRSRAVQVWPLAVLAFALLLAEAVPRRRLAGAALLLALPGVGAVADGPVGPDPEDARAWLERGLAQLDAGRPELAVGSLRAAAALARDPELRALAHFDRGLAELERGAGGAARDAFLELLLLRPHDAQARRALGLALARLDAEPPPEPPEPPPPPRRELPDRPAEPRKEIAEPETEALGDAERRALLERVRDDASRSLRRSLGESAATRRPGPAW